MTTDIMALRSILYGWLMLPLRLRLALMEHAELVQHQPMPVAAERCACPR